MMTDKNNSAIYHTLEKLEGISILNLIEGFPAYLSVLKIIFQNLYSFPTKIDIHSDHSVKQSRKFVYFSIIILFFLLVPIMIIHGVNIAKIPFIIRFITQFFVYGICVHIAIKIVGERDCSLKDTMVVYSYMAGIGAPLGILISYPMLLNYGLITLFGNPQEILELSQQLEQETGFIRLDNILRTLLSIFSITIGLSWFSKIYRIGKCKIFTAIVISGILGSLIQLFFLNPIFSLMSEIFKNHLFFL